MHPVLGDPVGGDLLLKVRDLRHIDHLGLYAVGLVAQALDGGHLGGLAAHGGLHRCAADLVGLGHIGAAGQMAGTALQRRKLDSAGLAAQTDADQVRQIAARAAQDGLVTEGIQLTCRGDQVAQENAVLVLDALADRDNNIVALFFQLGHALEERLLVKGALGQQDQVWAVAVRTGSQTGGSSQPAGVAAHDLGHRHAAQVVDAGIADDLLQDRGDVLRRAAVAGGVVGQHQVIVNGLGHADKADLAVDGLAVGAQLGDRVHRVVAADVKHRADVVLPEQLKQLHKRLLVNGGVGQLVAAAAQKAGRRALEQLNVHLVAQHGVQIDELALKHALDAVLHPVDMGCAASLGGLIDARQTGVDDGSRAARLTNQNIFHKFTSRIFYFDFTIRIFL